MIKIKLMNILKGGDHLDYLSRTPVGFKFKYLPFIMLLYISIYLASAAVAYKLVMIGPILEPGPPFIFPVTYVIADIIAEVYGYTIAKKIIWLTLLCELIFALLVTFVVNLPAPGFWHHQAAYNQVFGHTIRFVLSGIFAVLASNFINVYLISKIKILMKGKYFWLRSIISSGVGGLVLVFIIIVFGYMGTVSFKEAVEMFFFIYLLEFLYSCVLAWPAWFIAGFLKFKEKLDVYDINTNFNPFKF